MTTPEIALVTGGSRGLGKNMALSLAANGLDVLLTYHSQKEEVEAVEQPNKCFPLVCPDKSGV